jgi:hypothetical protein
MAQLHQLLLWAALLCSTCLAFLANVRDIADTKRSIGEIRESYDYVIVGGGTSGLTVADRLTEDPKSTHYTLLNSWA